MIFIYLSDQCSEYDGIGTLSEPGLTVCCAKTCGSCGGVGCTSKNLLRSHRQVHNKIVCKECGKMFRKKAMASHITRAHTENHLKPYICKICGKGFPVPQNYR